MRFVLIAAAMVAAFVSNIALSAPAMASDLAYFYCFAPDAGAGETYVSDVHAVGPIAERRHYGEDFARYLRARGKLSGNGTAYCVMRATMREIEQGRTDLAQGTCPECTGAERFIDINWPRGGSPIKSLRVSSLPTKSDSVTTRQAAAEDRRTASSTELSDREAKEVLNFFFGKMPPELDANDKRFAQAILLQSARASAQMGLVETMALKAMTPAATPTGVIKAVAKRLLKNLGEPQTVQRALERDQYAAVVGQYRWKLGRMWEERIENDDSSALTIPAGL